MLSLGGRETFYNLMIKSQLFSGPVSQEVTFTSVPPEVPIFSTPLERHKIGQRLYWLSVLHQLG